MLSKTGAQLVTFTLLSALLYFALFMAKRDIFLLFKVEVSFRFFSFSVLPEKVHSSVNFMPYLLFHLNC